MNVYDFDKTIYTNDSTIEFYFYCIFRTPKVLVALPKQIKGAILYLLKKISKDKYKEYFYSFLPYVKNIDKEVENFTDKRINKIHQWYFEKQKKDDVVISASPEFLVSAFCKKIGIKNVIASEIDKKSGKLLSENCKGKEKVARFFKKYNNEIDEFYSDSRSDNPLAAISKKAYLVKGSKIFNWNETEISNVKLEKEEKKKDLIIKIILVIISLTFLITLAYVFFRGQAYSKNKLGGDRTFSLDDKYYTESVFNPQMVKPSESCGLAVKHPLMIVFGNRFAAIEAQIFSNINNSTSRHYTDIILFQILLTTVGVIILYKIFREIIKIDKIKSLLLCLIYLVSNSTIIFTLFVDSFIYSSFLIILAYYMLSKKKYVLSGVIGALIFGVTITNVIIWAILVLFLIGFKDIKGLIKIGSSFLFTSLIIFIFVLTPEYSDYICNNFFNVVNENSKEFTDKYEVIDIVKPFFHFMCVAPLFYINIVNTDHRGLSLGKAISFTPDCNSILSIVTVIWFSIILYTIIKKYKNKNVVACSMVLLYNLLLHGGKQFGLKEAFLYSTHHFSLQLILISICLIDSKHEKKLKIFLTIVIVLEIVFNMNAVGDIIGIVKSR